jgi:hypothetical protein
MTKPTFNKVASALAKAEGLKHQSTVGDVRELLSLLSVMMVQDPSIIAMLISNGVRKSKQSKKRKG